MHNEYENHTFKIIYGSPKISKPYAYHYEKFDILFRILWIDFPRVQY